MIEQIGIYKITSPSNKIYVGMTFDSFKNRWKGHKKLLQQQKHTCRALQRAANKYGIESLIFEELEVWDKPFDKTVTKIQDNLYSLILQREVYWWNFYKNNGYQMYNGCPTGTGSVYHKIETRQAIGDAMRKGNKIKPIAYSVIQICEICKKEFVSNDYSKTCSSECLKTLRAKQLKERDRKTKIPLSDKDKIIELYNSGMSLQEIGKVYGVSYRTVHYFMVKNDIPRRNLSESQKFSKIKCC